VSSPFDCSLEELQQKVYDFAEVIETKCACNRCSAIVKTTDYTYPECPNCFLNLDGRCA